MAPNLKEAWAHMGATTRAHIMGRTTSKVHLELDTARQGVVLLHPDPQIMAAPEVAIHPLEMGMPLP